MPKGVKFSIDLARKLYPSSARKREVDQQRLIDNGGWKTI
jgi:hypothetical protein